MDKDTTIATPSRDAMPPASNQPAEAESTLLWYCDRCTRLILPPGATGVVVEEGERCCHECTPDALQAPQETTLFAAPRRTPAPPVRDKISSKSRIKPITVANPAAASFDDYDDEPQSRPRRGKFWILGGAVAAVLTAAPIYFFYVRENTTAGQSSTAKAGEERQVLRPLLLPETKKIEGGGEAPPADAVPLSSAQSIERAERKRALEQGGGLFSTLHAPEAPKPAIEKTAAVPNAAGVEFKAEDFETKFNAVQALLEAEKFSEATGVLDALKKEFAGAPWWETKKESVTQARETLKRKLETYEQDAADAAELARKAEKLEQLTAFEKEWSPKLALGEQSAKPASRVLDAVRGARERIEQAAVDKRFAALAEPLDSVEKKLKTKLPRHEYDLAAKQLVEFRSQLSADPAAAEKLGERWAGLNFDLRASRGPERLLFHLDSCKGDPCEIFYDFSNDEQLTAWKFVSDGSDPGGVELDPKVRTLLFKVSGEHAFDLKWGKHAPKVQMPFYFNSANWYIEADAAVLKAKEHDKDKKELLNLSYGLFISDGANNLIRFGVREQKRGLLTIAARIPNGDDKETTAHLNGKQEDRIRIRVACINNMLAFVAMNGTKSVPAGRARLPFEPKLIGLYIESRDKEENAVVAFDNLKLAGSIDKEKLKAALELRRSAEISAAKTELIRASKAAPIQK